MALFQVIEHPFTDKDGRVHGRRTIVDVPVAVGRYFNMRRIGETGERGSHGVDEVKGVGEQRAKTLRAKGVETAGQLAELDPSEHEDIPSHIVDNAREHVTLGDE